jgi:hypothetical protein
MERRLWGALFLLREKFGVEFRSMYLAVRSHSNPFQSVTYLIQYRNPVKMSASTETHVTL